MKKNTEIHTLNRERLYERVADHLEKMILEGQDQRWKEGEKLPSEQELADSFGVSRNIVREAVKLLKERGLAEPKNGLGVYITRPNPEQLSAFVYRYVLLNHTDLRMIYDTRILLEEYCVGCAAARCTEEDLERVREIVSYMKDARMTEQEFREADYMFHIALAEISGNPLNVMMISALKDVFLTILGQNYHNLEESGTTRKDHEMILEAVANHDGETAKALLIRHLEDSYKNASKYHLSHNETITE
ncbi:MAG: FadR/GntR family transcriptional regulator [Eubacteriales bacterium]|nr:FadR/GntR family transcriptional regulator [Eubacteriales bacterium]